MADLRTMVEVLGDVARVLARADPVQRGKVYADLGVTLTYRPDQDLFEMQPVPVLASACAEGGVGGGITPARTRVLRGVLDLRAA